jgi:hypothetical protein
MFSFKHLSKYLLALGLCLILAACGGGAPVTFEQVPVPSDAQESTTSDPVITSMQDSMKQSMGDKVSKFEFKTYTISSEWTTIQSFYDEQLKTSDWKAEEQLSVDADIIKMQGWTRGALAGEQALIVGYYTSLMGEEPYLMVMLASE